MLSMNKEPIMGRMVYLLDICNSRKYYGYIKNVSYHIDHTPYLVTICTFVSPTIQHYYNATTVGIAFAYYKRGHLWDYVDE